MKITFCAFSRSDPGIRATGIFLSALALGPYNRQKVSLNKYKYLTACMNLPIREICAGDRLQDFGLKDF